MPQISLPQINLPDIKFRDGRLRDVRLPDIDLRDHLPDVDLSRISLPGAFRDMSMPDVHMPDVHMPDLHRPDVHLPDVRLRDVKAPHIDLSGVDLRALDPRRIDLSGVDTKRLREFARFGRPAPRPASPLPWVVVAAAGGLFAGWWLATSSVTGPRVRELADRVRGRINDWRAARSDWDDDQTETIWSNEHMGQPDHTLNLSDAHPGGTWSEVATSDSGSGDASSPEGDAESVTAHDHPDAGHN